MAERSKVFIAYCFPEKRWLDRVQAALEPFAGEGRCIVWDERKLRAGIAWKTELPDVLATTKVAMMIVSDLFLESDFIARAKLPALLERERESGLEICWVLAGHCLFELAGLKEADMGNRAGAAFDGLGLAQRDAEVAAIAKKVAKLLGVEAPQIAAPSAPKKVLLPSAIPQVLEPKPVRKKRRNFGAKKDAPEKAAQPAQPLPEPIPAPTPEPVVAAEPIAAVTPEPVPLEKPIVAEGGKNPAPAAQEKAAAVAPPAPEPPKEIPTAEISLPVSTRALSLETMIQTRQATVLKLSRLARGLVIFASLIALASVAALFAESLRHFFVVFGFAVFAASVAMWLYAHALSLGQGLVGMRYTASGLADEALPARQRDALVRKADEYLAQH